jgi:hypothetical protein
VHKWRSGYAYRNSLSLKTGPGWGRAFRGVEFGDVTGIFDAGTYYRQSIFLIVGLSSAPRTFSAIPSSAIPKSLVWSLLQCPVPDVAPFTKRGHAERVELRRGSRQLRSKSALRDRRYGGVDDRVAYCGRTVPKVNCTVQALR